MIADTATGRTGWFPPSVNSDKSLTVLTLAIASNVHSVYQVVDSTLKSYLREFGQ